MYGVQVLLHVSPRRRLPCVHVHDSWKETLACMGVPTHGWMETLVAAHGRLVELDVEGPADVVALMQIRSHPCWRSRRLLFWNARCLLVRDVRGQLVGAVVWNPLARLPLRRGTSCAPAGNRSVRECNLVAGGSPRTGHGVPSRDPVLVCGGAGARAPSPIVARDPGNTPGEVIWPPG